MAVVYPITNCTNDDYAMFDNLANLLTSRDRIVGEGSISNKKKYCRLSILGAGPAGLAVGYFATKENLSFTIYEGSNRVGGNCITLRQGEFLFDSGAHRLHDRFPDITSEIKELLGGDLHKVEAPSQIYQNHRFIDFPLSPLNLLRKLGPSNSVKASFSLLRSRLKTKRRDQKTFEDFALGTYGKVLAEKFLLNYSEKLWGAPCSLLSPEISGSRMKGLSLRTFLIEAILGRNAKVQHLDGSFYYPPMGYGTICEEIAKKCGMTNIRKNAKITRIFHDYNRVTAIEVNQQEITEVEAVVSTLPMNLLISLMEPAAPEEVKKIAGSLRFRNVILAAYFIHRPRITHNASVYFPERQYPFTRIYEPKNRSEYMSPAEKTSLVAEIPCQPEDHLWNCVEANLAQSVWKQIATIFDIKDSELLDTKIVRLQNAYPVLEIGVDERIAKLRTFLQQFTNLKITGRSGIFTYTHLHDMMKFGKDLVFEILADPFFLTKPDAALMGGD